MSNINWSKWSAIAEIISSIAILVTLIYLSIQTTQNIEASLASTRQTMITTDLEVLRAAMDNPSIFIKMSTNQELTPEDERRLQTWLVMLVRTREYQWLQYKNGLLDKQSWEAYLSGLRGNLSYQLSRSWWNNSAYNFDHEFVDEVNKFLADVPIIQNYTSPFKKVTTLKKP